MANEATVRAILQVRKGNVNYPGIPGTFSATILAEVAKGPVPGALTIDEDGTDIDLSELMEPGLCQISNLEPDADTDLPYVEYGSWDPRTREFSPIGEMLPGETYVLRLSRYLSSELVGTGTGTGTGGQEQTKTFRMKAIGGVARVYVGAFER